MSWTRVEGGGLSPRPNGVLRGLVWGLCWPFPTQLRTRAAVPPHLEMWVFPYLKWMAKFLNC